MFNISTLEKVYIGGNSLTGSLPNNICSNYNSCRLKFLNLGANMLHGRIPSSWCQCSQLEVLSLSLNKLSGPIPRDIRNMTALQLLYLYRSNLTGEIPKQIGHLRNLKKLVVAENEIVDMLHRLNIMIDVASALEYLHHRFSTPVIHCDLNPSNVLLDEDMIGHVSDFGMAKLLNKEDSGTHTRTLATLCYMAPEYGMEGMVSSKCDVYSYGIMLMKVFTRTKPSDEIFAGDLNIKTCVQNYVSNEVMRVVDANLLDPNDREGLNETLKCLASIMELAISCTAQSPRDRITMPNVLSTLEKLKSKLLKRQ